jgi:hypothetical protein
MPDSDRQEKVLPAPGKAGDKDQIELTLLFLNYLQPAYDRYEFSCREAFSQYQ